MSNIDKRVVDMNFNNGQFESGVKDSVKSLENLKKALNLDESARSLNHLANVSKSFSLAGIADGVQNISNRFSALGVIGLTVLQNITNSVINLGKQLITSLAITPLKQGLQEYETQINAIQTILANTASKGTTLQQVNAALDELNEYSDKTIYNFTEMSKNIGTFTAAGIDLDTSVAAIKGIANLAAVSGSNSQQASTAMYQLSQALASGTVRLMDWNSVVNAGMGGEVFKNALMETARVHGVAIDDMVKKEGSFRETLQSGWLTSQILTETLSKFTGDLSAEQLKMMGYTEQQTAEILKMGQIANDAATKVKTFSQLMQTVNEAIQSGWAQSWRIVVGDFEEAKSFWTDISNILGKMVSESSDTRNSILQGWKDLGGRQAILYAVQNAFSAVINVLNTFKEAFREIFPPITAKQLFDISNAIRIFTSNLVRATKENEKLKTIFKGVAALFDIIFRAVSAVAGAFGRLVGAVMPSGNSIMDFLSKIANYIIGIDEAVRSTDFFNKVIANIGTFIEQAKTSIVGFYNSIISTFQEIKTWFKTLFSDIDASGFKVFGDAIGQVVEKIKERLKMIFAKPDTSGIDSFTKDIKEKLGPVGVIFESLGKKFKTIISTLGPSLSKFGTGIGNVFGKIGEAISSNISKINWNNIFDTANAALIASLILAIRRFINEGASVFGSVKDVLSGPKSFFTSITGILDGVRDSIKTFQASIKANTLLTIAIALAILAASLIALSMIDSQKLTAATIAITALFADLVTSMTLFEKVGIGGSMKLAATLLGISAALLLLSASITILAKLDEKQLARGVMAIGAVLAELALFLKLTGGSQNVIATAIGLNILGVALLVIAGAMKSFGNMPSEVIQDGLLRMGEALAILFAAVKLMPKDMPIIGIGLMLISGAILILAKAISAMGSIDWNTMERGLVGLGGSLGLIAIGINAMRGALTGAAALVVATAALALLLPVLKGLGNLSLKEIGTGLLAIAGTFVILGVAGLILGPLVPVLLGLSAAVLLLGIGIAGIGVGLLAFSAGLASLAVSGAVGAAAIVAFVTTVLGVFPLLITAFIGGIALLATGIISVAPVIVAAFMALLMQFITAIVNVTPTLISALGQLLLNLIGLILSVVPKFVDAVFFILTNILQTLASYVPTIVQAGFDILLGFLRGIRDNIAEVVTTAMDIVINFLDAIAKKLPDVIQSGVNLILSFIEGVTKAIRENNDRLITAALDLGAAIIEGAVKGVTSGMWKLTDLLVDLAKKALQAMKDALGIKSPSKEAEDIGKMIPLGFVEGITNYTYIVEKAVEELGKRSMKSMTNILNNISDSISNNLDMSPTIRPVIDLTGITSGGKQIDKLLTGKIINISSTTSRLPSVTNGIQDSKDLLDKRIQNGSNQQISFTQNNYSPEALSRVEIYRQTKNQLLLLKGLV